MLSKAHVWVCEWPGESNGPPRCTCKVTFPAGVGQHFPFKGAGKVTTWPSPTWGCPLHMRLPPAAWKKPLPAFHISPLCSASMQSLILSTVLTSFGLTHPACLTASHAGAPVWILCRSYRTHNDSCVFVALLQNSYSLSGLWGRTWPQCCVIEFLRHTN